MTPVNANDDVGQLKIVKTAEKPVNAERIINQNPHEFLIFVFKQKYPKNVQKYTHEADRNLPAGCKSVVFVL